MQLYETCYFTICMRLMTKQCYIDAASYDHPQLSSIQCTQVENHVTSARNITKSNLMHYSCACYCPIRYRTMIANGRHNFQHPISLCTNLTSGIISIRIMRILSPHAGFACAGNAGDVFPARPQRKPLVRDLSMHHGTYLTHMPWCMSGH